VRIGANAGNHSGRYATVICGDVTSGDKSICLANMIEFAVEVSERLPKRWSPRGDTREAEPARGARCRKRAPSALRSATQRRGDQDVILCRKCRVRIEKIETAGRGDIWMHKIANDAPEAPWIIYHECRYPNTVATP